MDNIEKPGESFSHMYAFSLSSFQRVGSPADFFCCSPNLIIIFQKDKLTSTLIILICYSTILYPVGVCDLSATSLSKTVCHKKMADTCFS